MVEPSSQSLTCGDKSPYEQCDFFTVRLTCIYFIAIIFHSSCLKSSKKKKKCITVQKILEGMSTRFIQFFNINNNNKKDFWSAFQWCATRPQIHVSVGQYYCAQYASSSFQLFSSSQTLRDFLQLQFLHEC